MAGLTRYQVKPGSSFICGTQPDRDAFINECNSIEATRPDCKKPVLHFSLSLPTGDRLDDTKWTEATTLFLDQMGLADHSFFCVRHTDTNHDHVHVAVCKIGANGQIWNTQKSAIRAMAACVKIEEIMGLTKTQTLADFRSETGNRRRVVSDGSTQEFRRTGKVKSAVQLAIQKRKAEEKTNEQNRNTHRQPAQNDGGLDKRKTPNPNQVQVAGSPNNVGKKGDSDSKIANDAAKKIEIEMKKRPSYIKRSNQTPFIDPETNLAATLNDRKKSALEREKSIKSFEGVTSFNIEDRVAFLKNNVVFAELSADRTKIHVLDLEPEHIDFAIDQAIRSGLIPLEIFGDEDFILAAEKRADKLGIAIKNRVSPAPVIPSFPNFGSSENQGLTEPRGGFKTPPSTPLARLKSELDKIDANVKNGNISKTETSWRYPTKIREWINSEKKLDPSAHHTILLRTADKDHRIHPDMTDLIGLDMGDASQNDHNDEAADQSHKMRM